MPETMWEIGKQVGVTIPRTHKPSHPLSTLVLIIGDDGGLFRPRPVYHDVKLRVDKLLVISKITVLSAELLSIIGDPKRLLHPKASE